MRRVYLGKAFVAGCLLALTLGAAASTLLASTQEKPDPSPITVPVGRVGDRVVYAYFTTDPIVESLPEVDESSSEFNVNTQAPFVKPGFSSSPAPAPTLEPMGPRAWEVKEVRTSFDAAHQPHRALLAVYNKTLADRGDYQLQIAEHIDLQTRTVFRRDSNLLLGGPNAPVEGNVNNAAFLVEPASLPGLPYQGLTLRLNEVLEDRAAPELDRGGAQASHIKTWVRERALVDGRDAYAVVREYAARGPVPASFADGGANGATQFEATIRVLETDWMSRDFAYPVLHEIEHRLEYEADGKPQEIPYARELYKLQHVDVGTTAVPWGADGASDHFATQRDDLERQASGAGRVHPRDGTNSRLSYKLGDAISNVENDATLATFQLWRQTHPGHMIVGAHFHQPVTTTLSATDVAAWRLLYAAPSGAAFLVTSESGSAGVVRNFHTGGVNGERTIPAFTAASFPSSPPTISALEGTWEGYVSPASLAAALNYVRWGLDVTASNERCMLGASGTATEGPSHLVLVFEAGHSQNGNCTTQSDRGTDSSSLAMDLASGLVVRVVETKFRYDFGSLGLPFGPEAHQLPAREAATIPTGLTPPGAAETTATSAGFLAAFLASYFWPALKFASAKAGLLVVGYAKIRREDILNNPAREQILTLIQSNPGIHASELARQVNAGWGTIVYHLGVLEKNRMITSLIDGRHKRFFPADTVDFSKRGQLAALMNQTSRRIYELIDEAPGVVQAELAGRTGLTVPTVIWHLQRLEAVGLVGRDKQGRRFHYFANPAYEPKQYKPDDAVEVA